MQLVRGCSTNHQTERHCNTHNPTHMRDTMRFASRTFGCVVSPLGMFRVLFVTPLLKNIHKPQGGANHARPHGTSLMHAHKKFAYPTSVRILCKRPPNSMSSEMPRGPRVRDSEADIPPVPANTSNQSRYLSASSASKRSSCVRHPFTASKLDGTFAMR